LLPASPSLPSVLQADEHCKSSGKLQLVGYYQANELSDDCDLGPFGKKVAQKIRAQCAQAAVLLVSPRTACVAPGDAGTPCAARAPRALL
jgi:hypothetical protein